MRTASSRGRTDISRPRWYVTVVNKAGEPIVRVDLWKLFGKPVRIQAVTLTATGGKACFDQILLGKTEEALPKNSRPICQENSSVPTPGGESR